MTEFNIDLTAKKKHSILSLIPLFKAIEEQGSDPEELLRSRGLSLDSMTGAAVIDQELELEIVSDAIDLLNDPLLGIKVGSQVTFTSYGTYAMLLMTAQNFLDAAKAAVQFQSLSLLFSHMTLHINQDWFEMRYTFPEAQPKLKQFIADRDLMGTYIFIREFLDNAGEVILGAGTARTKPNAKDLLIYNQYIDFDIQFDQPYNWIRMPSSIFRTQQKHGNRWAHKLYRVQAYELMRKFYPDSGDVVARVKQIMMGYDAQYPSVPEVAKMFGVSERTIRRKLDDANTSYRELIDEHKKNRALDMLSSSVISVNQLAESLGYAESASFLRAFKRWTGTTPKQYVKNKPLM